MDTEFAHANGMVIEVLGQDQAGNEITRRVEAGEDVMSVEARVRAEGGRVFLARRVTPERRRPRGISAEEFARFNEMLAASVKRDVPLLDGVRDVARGMGGPFFRNKLQHVEQRLAAGASLQEAFDPERAEFPPLYGRLLEAGAAAGNLPEVLLAMSRNIRTEAAFRRGVIESCVYPVVLAFTAFVFLIVFSLVLYPRLSMTAASLPMDMPAVARMMTGQSETGRILLGVITGVLCLAILWWGFLRNLGIGRRIARAAARRVPFYGMLYEAAVWSVAAETLALLLRAETPAPAALNLTGSAIGCRWVRDAFGRMDEGVVAGKSFAEAARDARDVPLPVIRAFDSGESRNDAPGALEALAVEYRRRASRRAQVIVRYLPAILALVLGVFVLLTALTVFGPYIRFWRAPW